MKSLLPSDLDKDNKNTTILGKEQNQIQKDTWLSSFTLVLVFLECHRKQTQCGRLTPMAPEVRMLVPCTAH
ncbi:hypothetical protein E5288_WYG019921 [Bos mutus]|uniref:Uncharacterized protein n=1 Tax=Bos mutus TaxID=72004 RepID=A0A6B0RPB4_9CETA|nr:hypothetical protein [Bos mutus]